MDNLYKVQEQLLEHKNGIIKLNADIEYHIEELNDVRRELGDCDLAKIIKKRKEEFAQMMFKYDRVSGKEMKEIQRGFKASSSKSVIEPKLKWIENRLQEIEIANDTQVLLDQLTAHDPALFTEMGKNTGVIQDARELRKAIR